MLSTEKIPFEQLPDAVAELTREVVSLKELITGKFAATTTTIAEDRWMSLDELCEYLPDKPSKATVYGWVNVRKIPYHKRTKKLAFLKSEIDKWMQDARRKTAEELREESIKSHGYRKGGAL